LAHAPKCSFWYGKRGSIPRRVAPGASEALKRRLQQMTRRIFSLADYLMPRRPQS
jgi:hypothetical protein